MQAWRGFLRLCGVTCGVVKCGSAGKVECGELWLGVFWWNTAVGVRQGQVWLGEVAYVMVSQGW